MRLLEVLQKGKCLTNVAFWKKIQIYLNIVIALLPVIAILFPNIAIEEFKTQLFTLLTALTTVNGYLTVASTEKIGFQSE